MRKILNDENNYWDSYYGHLRKNSSQKMPPSQFAAFCCAELMNKNINFLVDIAAGDGRDTVFFANQGFKVFALDKSKKAIKLLNDEFMNHPDVQVLEIDATKDKLPQSSNFDLPHAYYARFFLHTLEENYLIKFFNNLSKSMKSSDYFFAEYRNEKDKNLTKETPEHFRKFYKSMFIKSLADKNGFDCIYEVEGKGFSKWKNDDANISRQIFIKKAEF